MHPAIPRLLAFTILVTACARRVPPAVTPPMSPYANEDLNAIRFRNVTHPTISPFWGRAKSDGENNVAMDLLKVARINWIPVSARSDLTTSSRLEKQTVCGTFGDTVFIADKPDKRLPPTTLYVAPRHTSEFDWNLVIKPDLAAFVDTATLFTSSRRVFPIKFDFKPLDAGKYFTTKYWWTDATGSKRLEVEVTPPESLLSANINPFPCETQPCQFSAQEEAQPTQRPTDRICAYGPWVQESLHGFRPEIHPAEALYWNTSDGALHVLMLQDASHRFDAKKVDRWWSVLASTKGPHMLVPAEHWIQEAMIGELRVPLKMQDAISIELIGQEHLEEVGTSFPSWPIPAAAQRVSTSDSRIQAFTMEVGGTRQLYVRAQIRGAEPGNPLINNGSFVYLKIKGTSASTTSKTGGL